MSTTDEAIQHRAGARDVEVLRLAKLPLRQPLDPTIQVAMRYPAMQQLAVRKQRLQGSSILEQLKVPPQNRGSQRLQVSACLQLALRIAAVAAKSRQESQLKPRAGRPKLRISPLMNYSA